MCIVKYFKLQHFIFLFWFYSKQLYTTYSILICVSWGSNPRVWCIAHCLPLSYRNISKASIICTQNIWWLKMSIYSKMMYNINTWEINLKDNNLMHLPGYIVHLLKGFVFVSFCRDLRNNLISTIMPGAFLGLAALRKL